MRAEPVYTAYTHEVMLKGRNQSVFLTRLVKNLSQQLKARGVQARPKVFERRILIQHAHDTRIREALTHTFGLHHAWQGWKLTPRPQLNELARFIQEHVEEPFSLTVKRIDKTYEKTSQDVKQELLKTLPRELLNPEAARRVRIEIHTDSMLVLTQRIECPGGLPLGVTGKALCLLSGGIDSPAAAWLLMKRGVRVDYLHYHTFKQNEDVLQTKIPRIITALNAYALQSTLWLTPYHAYQLRVYGKLPRKHELVAFRLFMLIQAWLLAQREGYDAICTGDNLAQVASQTMVNMRTVSQLSRAFILRPLLTYDKEEIIGLAKRIGTYEESIKPYKDCCSLISPNPATRVTEHALAKSLTLVQEIAEETLPSLEAFPLAWKENKGKES